MLQRARAVASPLLALVLLAGCTRVNPAIRQLVWSPDGAHAALITTDGLYLTDATGALSPLLAADVKAIAWFNDSRRVVLARSRRVSSWPDLESALPPERLEQVVAKGEAIWALANAPDGQTTLEQRLDTVEFGWLSDEADAIGIYMNFRYGEALRERFGDEGDGDTPAVTVTALATCRLSAGGLEETATLFEDIGAIALVRISPDDRLIAFVTYDIGGSLTGRDSTLRVVGDDGSAPAATVERHTGFSPDWSHDARRLVYFQSHGTGRGDRDNLGRIIQREVLDTGDTLQLGSERTLAVLLEPTVPHVRALPDGRCLFATVEASYPTTYADARLQRWTETGPRTHLYLIGAPQGDEAARPLTPLLPRAVFDELGDATYSDISGDLKHVLFAARSEVLLVTVETGDIERFPQGSTGFDGPQYPLPTWRAPGEFTYIRNDTGRNELVLRRGDSEVILSRAWPDRLLQPPVEARPQRAFSPMPR